MMHRLEVGMNNRKLMFSLAALVVAGVGLAGCDDSSSSSGGSGKPGAVACGDVAECVEGYCQDGVCTQTCDEIGGCSDEARCNDVATCHKDKTCKDVGTCTYECGKTANSCQWAVCASHARCANSQTCEKDKLDPYGDFDGDGILNHIELNSSFLDPCSADTDGDTIPDNLEDLNGNGIFEPWLGETDPNDSNSKPTTEGVGLINSVCSMDAQGTVTTETMKTFNIAVPKGIGGADMVKTEATDDIVRYDDEGGIAMVFGSTGGNSFTAKTLFKSAQEYESQAIVSFVEASNFTSAVPLTSWKETGYLKGYDASRLQVVPDHEVSRYIYRVSLQAGTSIQKLRDAIANALNLTDATIAASADVTTCEPDGGDVSSATVYMARSTYQENGKSITVYSVAVACSEKANDNVVNARMTDIMTGTHVAPIGLDSATRGYNVLNTIKCQQADFGDSSSKVDFIWVVDNSGSMEDELDNLAETAATFMNKLKRSKIDYRIGVAGTDSYVLDEWIYEEGKGLGDKDGWHINPFTSNSGEEYPNELVNPSAYYTYSGLRKPFVQKNAMMTPAQAQGHMTLPTCADTQFACLVKAVSGGTCNKGKGKNLCGLGHEDGLKSGLIVLDRLSLDVSKPYEEYEKVATEADFPEIDKEAEGGAEALKKAVDEENAKRKEQRRKSNSIFDRSNAQSKTCKSAEDLAQPACQQALAGQMLRDDALHYVIWVSDEESRQFKEPVREGDGLIASSVNLRGCLTGYKLENEGFADETITEETFKFDNPDLSKLVYSMYTGSYEGNDPNKCNPSMKNSFKEADGKYIITEDSTLADIHEQNPAFYDMLMYYIKEYHKYAGQAGVAGFALVGDIGKENGGFCAELGDNPGDKTGANYGLGYIMMAKYLSKLTPDGANDGKGGGYASICSENYSDTVDAIFQDVLGRLSRHGLEGYPVASTIRVAIVKQGSDTATELTRGKDWSYDASQNTITFSYTNGESTDKIAISYVLWQKTEG